MHEYYNLIHFTTCIIECIIITIKIKAHHELNTSTCKCTYTNIYIRYDSCLINYNFDSKRGCDKQIGIPINFVLLDFQQE